MNIKSYYRKKFKKEIVFLLFVFLISMSFVACNKTYENNQNLNAQQNNMQNTNNQNVSQTEGKKTMETSAINNTENRIDNGLSEDAIIELLELTKDSIFERLGEEYEVVPAGPEGARDGYFYSKYGITIVFKTKNSDLVDFVNCDKSVSIKGLNAGMTLSEIQKVLGTDIVETWYETPENKIYETRCEFEKYSFWFYSNDKNEGDTTFIIINEA